LEPNAERTRAAKNSPRWTSDEAAAYVREAVAREYGHGRQAANDLSEDTKIPEPTARNIVEGRNGCSLANLFTMIETVPAVRAAIAQLCEKHAHPESERALHEFLQLAQRYMPLAGARP